MLHRPRSALFLPAANARAVAKARTLPCDVVILDLEDAVAPSEKDAARRAAVAAVTAGGFGDRPVAIRINGGGSAWHEADVAAIARLPLAAVVVPKVAAPEDLAVVRRGLGAATTPIWAMIETAAGIMALPAIAAATAATGLAALIAGTNDLALDLRCRPDAARTPLVPLLVQIVAAARSAGIAALDGVLNAIDDPARLAAEAAQGRMLGFDGKTVIHPSQIAAANAAFAPSAEETAWARSVVDAFADPAATGRGAIRVGSAMVERLHLAEAERILSHSA